MSNTSEFKKLPVYVSNRNGHDVSFETLGTGKVGTLIPVLVDEIYPNDKFLCGITAEAQLPPMASNFYGRVDLSFEAFFVPYRIIYGGWKQFYTQNNDGSPLSLPMINLGGTEFKSGTLYDYLGFGYYNPDPDYDPKEDYANGMNILPALAYHKIYADWYRDSRLQKDPFCTSDDEVSNDDAALLPSRSFANSTFSSGLDGATGDYGIELNDGIYLTSLRQRNYGKDYFTVASTDPQAGRAVSVAFDVLNSFDFQEGSPEEGDTLGSGSFTIAALRAANSLQRFFERHNIAGDRYPDRILSDWGILPADAITDQAIYLGQQKANVICNSVVNPQETSDAGTSSNPFYGSAGSVAGRASAFVQGKLAQFHAKEHGFFMVFMSLVPHSYYGSGCRRYLQAELFRSQLVDFPQYDLCGVGDQPIHQSEVSGSIVVNSDLDLATFGYTQRFAETKFIPDNVHGLLKDGESLSVFALKRTFDDVNEISSDFIQISTDALDDVTAVKSTLSQYGYTYDCGFSYKKSTCLPAYCIPSLENFADSHIQMVDNGGRRL